MARIRGRVTIARTTSASLTGDVSIVGTGGVAVTGNVTIDRQMADAFQTFPRQIGVELWLAVGGSWENVSGLIGEVSWGEDLDSVASWANVTLSDARSPRFASSSLTSGGLDARIYLRIRSAAGAGQWLAFSGVTGGGKATGQYRPRTMLRCDSRTSLWGRQKASASAQSYSARTRGALLEEWCDRAGVGTVGMVIPDGARLYRAWDVTSVTGAELLSRIALVEGWRYRPLSDGTIEILPDGYTEGAARHTFTDANVFAFTEHPPDAPVTRWTLTGAQLDAASRADAGVRTTSSTSTGTRDGNYVTPTVTVTTTMDGNAEVFRQVDETIAGRLVRRTTIRSSWVTTRVVQGRGYVDRPTSRLSTRETIVSEWYSAKTSIDAGYGVLCSDGVYRESATETFRPVTKVVETLGWDGTQCYLQSKTTETWRYYAPLDSDPTYTRTETQWLVNGETEYRAPIETFRTVSYEVAVYSATDATTAVRKEVKAWHVGAARTRSDPPLSDLTVPQDVFGLVNTVGYSASSVAPGQYREVASGATGGASGRVQSGSMPRPPSASPTTPQHQTEPMQVVLAVGTSGYAANFRAETISDAMDKTELTRIATRYVEESEQGFATVYVVVHPGLPNLQVGDPVAVQFEAYHTTAKAGYVRRIERRVSIATGSYEQTTTVVVPWRIS